MNPSSVVLFGHTPAVLLDVDLPFLKVRGDLNEKDGPTALKLRIGVQSYQVSVTLVRPGEGGTFWVRLLEGEARGEFLEHRFLQDRMTPKADERRHNSRLKTTLSVASVDLPARKATTYDISETGLRLVTESPVASGTVLRLEVRDGYLSPEAEPVRVQGRVVWAAPQMNSLFHVGVHLDDATAPTSF